MAQRYTTCNYSEFDTSAKGEWVKADEHEVEINHLKAQVIQLRSENRELCSKIERMGRDYRLERAKGLVESTGIRYDCSKLKKLIDVVNEAINDAKTRKNT